jgi:hypothetical protein
MVSVRPREVRDVRMCVLVDSLGRADAINFPRRTPFPRSIAPTQTWSSVITLDERIGGGKDLDNSAA